MWCPTTVKQGQNGRATHAPRDNTIKVDPIQETLSPRHPRLLLWSPWYDYHHPHQNHQHHHPRKLWLHVTPGEQPESETRGRKNKQKVVFGVDAVFLFSVLILVISPFCNLHVTMINPIRTSITYFCIVVQIHVQAHWKNLTFPDYEFRKLPHENISFQRKKIKFVKNTKIL